MEIKWAAEPYSGTNYYILVACYFVSILLGYNKNFPRCHVFH